MIDFKIKYINALKEKREAQEEEIKKQKRKIPENAQIIDTDMTADPMVVEVDDAQMDDVPQVVREAQMVDVEDIPDILDMK